MGAVRRWLWVFVCLGLVCVAPREGHAKHVAFVVGNNSYPHLPPAEQLITARNDAEAVASELEALGYEVVTGTDLNRAAFIQLLFDFTSRIEPGDVALFYYAGHGISLDGGNYLLPSDIRPPQTSRRQEAQRLASLSVQEQFVLSSMRDAGASVSIAILDACRNNPIGAPDGRAVGASRGLARVTLPQGTFSIYSAGYGQTALDRLPGEGTGGQSVFTRVLLDKLGQPGMTLRGLALDVRGQVRDLAATAGHDQLPAYYDELGDSTPVLLAAMPGAVPGAAPASMLARTAQDAEIERMLIEDLRASDDPAMLRAYLETYPNGRYAAFARARLQKHDDEVADLRAQLKALGQSDGQRLRALEEQLAAALSARLEADQTAEGLRKRLAAAEEARRAAEQDRDRVMTQAGDQANADAAQKEVDLLNQQVATLRRQLASLQSLLDDANERERALGLRIQTLGTDLNATMARLAAEERKRRLLEEKARRADEEARKALLEELARKDARIAALERDLSGSASNSSGQTKEETGGFQVSMTGNVTLYLPDDSRFLVDTQARAYATVLTLFASDRLTLSAKGKAELDTLAKLLGRVVKSARGKQVSVLVEGHTDSQGSTSTNLRLSQERARQVFLYLNAQPEIEDVSFRYIGRGEGQPTASNAQPFGRNQNRRISFVVTVR